MALRISIHAPTKGVTMKEKFISNNKSISIHAPTKGVTVIILQTFKYLMISIHAPTKGVTRSKNMITYKKLLFQSTLPRRE